MADDNFIREVNEEYRQDQAKALFDKYGFWAIGLAVVVVLAAAGWRGYDYWQSKQAAASSAHARRSASVLPYSSSEERLLTRSRSGYPR